MKLQRHISNSPWIIHGKRLAEHSVEELLADRIVQLFQCESYKFSSAGREDADVLMLGSGRPFYYELVNPRNVTVTQEDMYQAMNGIIADADGKVSLCDLQIVSR